VYMAQQSTILRQPVEFENGLMELDELTSEPHQRRQYQPADEDAR
jgi:hypothetical protein